MAINITSNFTGNNYAVMQKFQNVYKKNEVNEKVSTKNPMIENTNETIDFNNNIREYLSNDEKKILKEIFGEISVDKNNSIKYNGPEFVDFLKGSKIDVKL